MANEASAISISPLFKKKICIIWLLQKLRKFTLQSVGFWSDLNKRFWNNNVITQFAEKNKKFRI